MPWNSDHPIADAAARSYFPELLASGVVIHAYGPPALHAKTVIVDHDAAIVGTANLDNRSLRLNFEVVAVCYGERPVTIMSDMFTHDLTSAREITARGLTTLSIGARLFEGAARLLSPML